MKNKCHIGKKTLWEKEKLLVTSNFSFSHNVFHSYIPLVRQNVALCGNGLSEDEFYVHTVQSPRAALIKNSRPILEKDQPSNSSIKLSKNLTSGFRQE